jgi:hypothetical protein
MIKLRRDQTQAADMLIDVVAFALTIKQLEDLGTCDLLPKTRAAMDDVIKTFSEESDIAKQIIMETT